MSRFGAELDFFSLPVDGGEPESWDWDEEVLICGGEGGYPRKPVPPEEPVVLGVSLGYGEREVDPGREEGSRRRRKRRWMRKERTVMIARRPAPMAAKYTTGKRLSRRRRKSTYEDQEPSMLSGSIFICSKVQSLLYLRQRRNVDLKCWSCRVYSNQLFTTLDTDDEARSVARERVMNKTRLQSRTKQGDCITTRLFKSVSILPRGRPDVG